MGEEYLFFLPLWGKKKRPLFRKREKKRPLFPPYLFQLKENKSSFMKFIMK